MMVYYYIINKIEAAMIKLAGCVFLKNGGIRTFINPFLLKSPASK
jgi:hypothetical protein